jgi:hypothetical protein
MCEGFFTSLVSLALRLTFTVKVGRRYTIYTRLYVYTVR